LIICVLQNNTQTPQHACRVTALKCWKALIQKIKTFVWLWRKSSIWSTNSLQITQTTKKTTLLYWKTARATQNKMKSTKTLLTSSVFWNASCAHFSWPPCTAACTCHHRITSTRRSSWSTHGRSRPRPCENTLHNTRTNYAFDIAKLFVSSFACSSKKKQQYIFKMSYI
jgi:hypothetical protein